MYSPKLLLYSVYDSILKVLISVPSQMEEMSHKHKVELSNMKMRFVYLLIHDKLSVHHVERTIICCFWERLSKPVRVSSIFTHAWLACNLWDQQTLAQLVIYVLYTWTMTSELVWGQNWWICIGRVPFSAIFFFFSKPNVDSITPAVSCVNYL